MAILSSQPAPVTESGTQQAENIQRIFKLQRDYRQEVARTSAKERIAKLRKLQKAILARQEDFRTALQADFGKHPTETDLTDIFPVTSEIKHTIQHLASWMRPHKVDTPLSMIGTSSEIRYEALGNTLIISPWNFPVNLTFGPLVACIAAGNTAMIKPSEFTPYTSRVMGELIEEVFEEREIALFEGDHTVSQELLQLPYHHIFFTGSPRVGKIVMRAAAENLSKVTLELGGKSPVIVDSTASLTDTAKRVAWGKCLNNGQICIAPDYMLVDRKVEQDLIAEMRTQIGKMYGESEESRKESDSYARIVNEGHFKRLQGLLEDAVSKGATVEVGGHLDEAQRYISPTVLTGVTQDMKIMQEEIFGPILPIMSYDGIQNAVDYINDGEKPLALYIFSKRKAHVEQILRSTSSGGVGINDTIVHYMNPNMPFGGVNNSGSGQSHGFFGFKSFSHARSILRQNLKYSANSMMYPPYTSNIDKLVDVTIKLF